MDTSKDAYKAKLEAQLKIWSAQIEGFKAKAEKATAEARIEILKHTDTLKVYEASARKQIAEVETAAADTWHRAKGGIEKKWSQLAGSIEAMWTKIAPETTAKS